MDLGVEGDLDMGLGLSRGGVEDDDVDLLEMLQQSMQVVEVEPTAGVVPTLGLVRQCGLRGSGTHEFALAVKYMECVHDRVALNRRRRLAAAIVVQAVAKSAPISFKQNTPNVLYAAQQLGCRRPGREPIAARPKRARPPRDG